MPSKIVVTGIGIITSIGNNKEENLSHLRLSQTGIKKAFVLDSAYTEKYLFGEIPFSTAELIDRFHLQNTADYTRTDVLAEIAIREAITDAGWNLQSFPMEDIAFITASTVGGMSEMNELYHDSRAVSDPSKFLTSYASSAHAGKMIRKFMFMGETAVINTACSSSSNSIMLGCRMLQQGKAKKALVGGVDALSKFTVNGFNSLGILSSSRCKVFDRDRDGLNLGEGAVYLTLEKVDENQIPEKHYGEVLGYGNANDSFHPSSLSDEGTGIKNAIFAALNKAKLSPDQIDLVQAHGTGTENNDVVETTTMSNIFQRHLPFFSSKTYVGHTLAASGAVGAVYALFALQNNEIYASLNFQTPIDGVDYLPVTSYVKKELQVAMSNAFGFNGNCTSLIFKK